MSKLKIISIEECLDKDYGETIIQYQRDNKTSFAFCPINIQDGLEKIQKWMESDNEVNNAALPNWASLSTKLVKLITINPFDMLFIEDDDEDWTEEMANEIWEEVSRLNLTSVVECGTDALITVYAGAMCEVDWAGHEIYGKPCL